MIDSIDLEELDRHLDLLVVMGNRLLELQIELELLLVEYNKIDL